MLSDIHVILILIPSTPVSSPRLHLPSSHSQLLQTAGGLTYVAEMHGRTPVGKMDHLACFLPALLALGVGAMTDFDPTRLPTADNTAMDHLRAAERLTETCMAMYTSQPTGIAPEFVEFNSGSLRAAASAPWNKLRPEAAEALFLMYRVTRDPKWREMGWTMFDAFNRNCRTKAGFSGLNDVRFTPASFNDEMPSYFLAETLKYFWLLFGDPAGPGVQIPLDQWVFNTEAHPLRVSF
ncbi:putative mannosyl-oligosaccharide 1; 2-alpha-mannosidase [Paratrimastix pyriformis]|uniref:alpha-1,2-Mannosidase n=1 Tax=Paratrimastix pyriformis TaxID=342808 RepID=A0ABQ8UKF1_9EUKA|nr:putative mannosyl-oligosaccharide 1; 2-alpha-mannosidase [Paratrimastix pyriformis]